jgi:hypothetical protein
MIVTAENVEEYYRDNVTNYKPHDWQGLSKTYGK